MEIGFGDRIPFKIIYFLTHFISKNSVQVNFLARDLTMGSSGAYEGPLTSSITMATPMSSSITIKTHIPTSSVQNVYPHYCSPFQLCFIVYIPPPPPSPHHMLVIVRHIYYFDYKGNWPLVCIKNVFYVKRKYIGFLDNVYLSNKKLSEVQFEAFKFIAESEVYP